MKSTYKLIVFLILWMGAIPSFGQFKLTGKIVNYSGKEALNINIPLVYGFYKTNSVAIPIAKDGTFNITLPIKTAKFANLIYQRKFYSLLLDQSKNLSLSINEADSSLKLISGTALPENEIMQVVDIEEYPFFFEQNNDGRFSNLAFDQLKLRIVQPYFAQRDQKIDLVMQSKLPLRTKLLIALELKSIAYNYLNDLARTAVKNRATIDSLIFYVFDKSETKPSVFPAGPQFYAFIDNYVRYLENKSLFLMKTQKIPGNVPLPYIGITFDSARANEGKISKAQWRINIATRNLSQPIVEQYSYQQLVNAYETKELRTTEQLAIIFKKQFPLSKHLEDINAKVNDLKAILAANAHNAEIKIFKGYEQLGSIYEVIKQFKGKVVYLDIWGTWCGPCKMEIPYLPKLKEKFKGQDIAYVYLDLDDDSDDLMWREFIKVNNLTGTHLRKTRATIAPIWKELLANAADKAEYYPQYFIFDKEGKLVVTKALRPSNEDELYQQLSAYLK